MMLRYKGVFVKHVNKSWVSLRCFSAGQMKCGFFNAMSRGASNEAFCTQN